MFNMEGAELFRDSRPRPTAAKACPEQRDGMAVPRLDARPAPNFQFSVSRFNLPVSSFDFPVSAIGNSEVNRATHLLILKHIPASFPDRWRSVWFSALKLPVSIFRFPGSSFWQIGNSESPAPFMFRQKQANFRPNELKIKTITSMGSSCSREAHLIGA
jgi:hypothetical protein